MGRFVPVSSVERRLDAWIWRPYILRRYTTIIQGPTGTNKTTMLLDIAARLSTGRKMPHASDSVQPSGVLWFSKEDVPSDFAKNLDASKGDGDRVKLFEADGTEFTLPTDEEFLESEIRRHDVSMVVFDPIGDYVEGNPNAEKPVRRAMAALNRVACRTDVGMVAIRHLNKNESASLLNRGAGSFA